MRRIALFDIDGTLLTMGSAARDSFTRALTEASGRPISAQGASFVGKTDPQIAREILTANGVDGPGLPAMIDETVRLYLGHFERALPEAHQARLLPGVPALLEALAARPAIKVALLTGNVERGARLKLDHFGISPYFDFSISAFGSDHADRYQLPAVALERARRRLGDHVEGEALVIIGDSEHDVLCGRSVGARAVAVATGWTAAATLKALGPDHLFEDLSATAAAVAAITGEAA